MPKSANQKLKILYVMDWLLADTDDSRGLTPAEILLRLENAGIKAERKAIYDDIETLRTYGLDIQSRKGKTTEYFVGARDFELPELKLLVDAVQGSKFITERKSAQLIKKLEALTSKSQARALQRQVYIANRIKAQNESIYYNVDALHTAIAESRKVSFKYFDYDIDRKRVFRKDGERYVVDPVGLVWDDENYYLISYAEKWGDFTHYRVDRMADIRVEEEPCVRNEATEAFNMAEYSKRTFGMFEGEEVRVTLLVADHLINVMYDRFGTDVKMYRVDDDTVRVIAVVKVAAPFFGWLAQFGDMVFIEDPAGLREEYVKHLKRIIRRYAQQV